MQDSLQLRLRLVLLEDIDTPRSSDRSAMWRARRFDVELGQVVKSELDDCAALITSQMHRGGGSAPLKLSLMR